MRNIFTAVQFVFLTSIINGQSIRKPDNYLKTAQRHLASLVKLPVQNEEIQDTLASDTGFPAAISSGSKYFQDVYSAQVSPDVMEFGHVRETPSDWEQRFEKINLKDLTRQGKVRWGDKHGGYGEHYWDYNHSGHDNHDGGEESSPNAQYTDYEPTQQESNPVPQKYLAKEQRTNYDLGNVNNNDNKFLRQVKSTTVNSDVRNIARQQRSPAASAKDDVEFISDGSRATILSGRTGRHGGNYRREPRVERAERGKRERDEHEEAAVEYDEFDV